VTIPQFSADICAFAALPAPHIAAMTAAFAANRIRFILPAMPFLPVGDRERIPANEVFRKSFAFCFRPFLPAVRCPF